MAQLPDFEGMTVDDIDAWRVALKREYLAAYEQSGAVRHRKANEENWAAFEKAQGLPAGTMQTISPQPAELGARGT